MAVVDEEKMIEQQGLLAPFSPRTRSSSISSTACEVSQPSRPKNIIWVEGLRGFAACMVVLHHIATGWFKWTFWPAPGLDETPHLIQLPFLRVLISGKFAVPLFALLTGYCCALKPMKLIRQNDIDGVYRTIQTSAVKRTPRILLSPIEAHFLGFLAVQSGLELASLRSASAFHLNMTPRPVQGLGSVLWALYNVVWQVPSRLWPYYDGFQWPIFELYTLGFITYIFVIVIANFKFRARMVCYFIMLLRSYQRQGDENLFLLQAIHGVMLADLTADEGLMETIRASRFLSRTLAYILLFFALLFLSFPYERPEWAWWSRSLQSIGMQIFPGTGSLIGIRWETVGVSVLFYAVWLSPTLQKPLQHPYAVRLGKNSYAIYLLHGTLLRTVFIWIAVSFTGLPWDTTQIDEEGRKILPPALQPRSMFAIVLGAVVFILATLLASDYWTKHVEPANERFTTWITDLATRDDAKTGGLIRK